MTQRKYAVIIAPPCDECRYYGTIESAPDLASEEVLDCAVFGQESWPKKCRHFKRARIRDDDGTYIPLNLW